MIIFLWICIYLSGSVCAAFLWREVLLTDKRAYKIATFDITLFIALMWMSWVSCVVLGIIILARYLQKNSYLINWINKGK